MRKHLFFLVALVTIWTTVNGQDNTNSRGRKKNLVVKEWNVKAGSTTPYLDNVVTYDELGRKVEEIEYASYGQKKRTTYAYDGTSTKCIEQVEYDDKNHPTKIKQFEYNDDGTRRRQLNYNPKGKLISTKTFEYSYK